jgi:hypothetical protein
VVAVLLVQLLRSACSFRKPEWNCSRLRAFCLAERELLRSCLSTSECHQHSQRRIQLRHRYLQCAVSGQGFVSNGNLITSGGPGSPYPGFSPCLPDYASDHERYDLVACAGVTGATTVNVATVNPSGDDNIFEETFWVSGQGNVTTAPEPGTLVMFGSGILGLAGLIRRKYNVQTISFCCPAGASCSGLFSLDTECRRVSSQQEFL